MPTTSLSGLILTGDELVADCRDLADAWEPNSLKHTGKPSQWIHFDRHARWFSDVKAYLVDRFGENSPEVQRWEAASNGGHTRYDPSDREPNPYLAYLLLYRMSVSHLKQLRSEDPAPANKSSLGESGTPESFKMLSYIKRRGGILGLATFLIISFAWIIIANAKTFKEGIETIQIYLSHF